MIKHWLELTLGDYMEGLPPVVENYFMYAVTMFGAFLWIATLPITLPIYIYRRMRRTAP